MTKERTLIHETRALCPRCLKALKATVFTEDDDPTVWMGRTCPDHGEFITRMWPDVDHYKTLRAQEFPKTAPTHTVPQNGYCPTGCGICQHHSRKVTLAEIEVTECCNLRCPVCFMAAESADTDPSLEELDKFYDAILERSGVDTAVQLTGGEPTIRKDLPEIIRMGREKGFYGIEINTNGVVIAQDKAYLQKLVEAGCTGIYLAFDGLRENPYEVIRGARLLETKMQAIKNCRELGIQIVLAMTIVSGVNDDQISDVIEFALDNSDVIVGVALQPAFTSGRFEAQRAMPISMGDVIMMLDEQTNGLITKEDIWSIGCSHPMCDTGTFLMKVHDREPGESYADAYVPVTREITIEEFKKDFNPNSPNGSIFIDMITRRGGSTEGGISVLIMNYMDAVNMDLERMSECSMFVTMADGRLIPFCSYQLTDTAGNRVYPMWGIEE